MNKRIWYKKAIYILVALSLFVPLGIIMGPLAMVGAEESAQYSAGQIESWLIDQVEGSSITHTSPTVVLNSAARTMTVDVSGTVGKAAGGSIEVALNHVTCTFDGSLDVKVNGEISALGMSPRFGEDGNDIVVTVACDPGGSPRVTAISNINIAGFTPSLSSGNLDKIVEGLTKVIEVSGLTVDSLGGNLTGLDVVDEGGTAKLQFSSDSGPAVKWDEAAIVSKLDNALDSLETQGEDYLLNGRTQGKWDLGVAITADTKLTLGGQATMFGLTASADNVDITFGDMTASVAGSVSVESYTTTFSVIDDLSCTNYVPSVTVTDLGIGDDYPGLRDWINDNKTGLINGVNQLASDVITDTGLQVGIFRFTNIGIVSNYLKVWTEGIPITGIVTEVDCTILEEAGLTLYEGIVEKDSTTSDIDGNYTLYAPAEGSYTVVAGKDGFKPRTQAIEVVAGTNTLNFRADQGLVPRACEMSYVLKCVNHWLYPVEPCGLVMSTVLAAVNAWLYPT